jgi:hypothetical protein
LSRRGLWIVDYDNPVTQRHGITGDAGVGCDKRVAEWESVIGISDGYRVGTA